MLLPIANAQESSIVACNGLDCTLCHLLETVSRGFTWLLWTSFAVAILFIIIGGFIYIGSRGNDLWMARAKKAVTTSLFGFAICLLAWLSIHGTFRIMGATTQDSWWKVDCGVSGTASFEGGQSQELTAVSKAINNEGQVSIELDENTTVANLNALYNNMSAEDIMVYGVGKKNWDPLTVMGKNTRGPELIYANMSKMKSMAESVSYSDSAVINTANAAGINLDEEIDKKVQEAVQLIFEFIASWAKENQDITVAITRKPGNLNVDPTKIPNSYPTSLSGVIGSMEKCFESGGDWFRFGSLCDLEKANCTRKECIKSVSDSIIDGCKCPKSGCVKSGKCK